MTNKLNLTPEQLEQENGISITAEQAAEYYAQLHPEMEAIADKELSNVSGGCFKVRDTNRY